MHFGASFVTLSLSLSSSLPFALAMIIRLMIVTGCQRAIHALNWRSNSSRLSVSLTVFFFFFFVFVCWLWFNSNHIYSLAWSVERRQTNKKKIKTRHRPSTATTCGKHWRRGHTVFCLFHFLNYIFFCFSCSLSHKCTNSFFTDFVIIFYIFGCLHRSGILIFIFFPLFRPCVWLWAAVPSRRHWQHTHKKWLAILGRTRLWLSFPHWATREPY